MISKLNLKTFKKKSLNFKILTKLFNLKIEQPTVCWTNMNSGFKRQCKNLLCFKFNLSKVNNQIKNKWPDWEDNSNKLRNNFMFFIWNIKNTMMSLNTEEVVCLQLLSLHSKISRKTSMSKNSLIYNPQ